jgi:uncharacterized protein YndB with AHSA1/START domain
VSIDITAETVIARPRDEVAAYMTDPAHDPAWIGGIREARLEGEPPLRAGSRVARVATFLGRRIAYVNQVTELSPTRLDMRSVQSPFPMRITYEFEPRDGDRATTVRNRVRGDTGRFFARAVGPLMAPLVRRSVRRDLERLRTILER